MCKIIDFKHAPCPTCLGKVSGRRDKRFCSLKCKNEHHRVARDILKSHFGEQQKRLCRNFLVLEGVLGPKGKQAIIHRNELFRFGFDLKSVTTSFRKNKKICFEVGNFMFSFLNNGLILIKRIKALSYVVPVFFRRWEIEFPHDLKLVGNEKFPKESNCKSTNSG